MDVLRLQIELDSHTQRKVVNGRFRLLQSIGQGQYGKVLLAEDLAAGTSKPTTKLTKPAKPSKLAKGPPRQPRYVAIKTINRVDNARLITKTYMSHTVKIKREIAIMKECNHPHVVQLYQVIDDLHFDKILLVLEYCELGEMDWKRYNHYHEKYHKDPARLLPLNRVLRDVALGLEYLHEYKHIIHRDLKPLNLLILRDRRIKIADFGVSLILENNANDDRELGKTVGTPAFYAPELCQFVNNRWSLFNPADLSKSRVDLRIDLWSLGVVLYCLFFHVLPFDGFNEYGLFKNIVSAPLLYPPVRQSSLALPDDMAELAALKKLILGLLEKDPADRPTLRDIMEHPFTTYDVLPAERAEFLTFNADLSRAQAAEKTEKTSQAPAKAADLAIPAESFAQKLRQLFISRLVAETAPGLPPKAECNGSKRDLEHVDDLLDSYLDESLSLGLLEDDAEPTVLDTGDLLSSLRGTPDVSPRAPVPATEDKKQAKNSADLVAAELLAAVVKAGTVTPTKPPRFGDRLGKPVPPLVLNKSNFAAPEPRSVVTIGPDLPLSLKAIFSPSRRFFNRIKRKNPPEPTLGLLTSVAGPPTFADLAPPPVMWPSTRSQRGLVSSIDSSKLSRNNSVTSAGSLSMSKLLSSSSSLNLHAYLTDPESPSQYGVSVSPRRRGAEPVEQDADPDSGSADGIDPDGTFTMDRYLDELSDHESLGKRA